MARSTGKSRGPHIELKRVPAPRSYGTAWPCHFGGGYKASGPARPDSAAVVPSTRRGTDLACTGASRCGGEGSRASSVPPAPFFKAVPPCSLGVASLVGQGSCAHRAALRGGSHTPHSSTKAVARSAPCLVLAEMALDCGLGSWAKTNTRRDCVTASCAFQGRVNRDSRGHSEMPRGGAGAGAWSTQGSRGTGILSKAGLGPGGVSRPAAQRQPGKEG